MIWIHYKNQVFSIFAKFVFAKVTNQAATMDKINSTLVIPMYNEEGNAGILIDRISDAMNGYHYELILIDDNSTDKPYKKSKKKKHPNVLIELKKLRTKFCNDGWFRLCNGDYVITLDGDLQNDPSDIPAMVELLEKRKLRFGGGNVKKKKILPSEPFLQNCEFHHQKSTKLNISDQGCALKVFTNETAKELNLYGETIDLLVLMAHLNGAKITEIP